MLHTRACSERELSQTFFLCHHFFMASSPFASIVCDVYCTERRYFQERLHNSLLPSLPSMKWRRPIVWEDVLFEAPSWARSSLQPSDVDRTKGFHQLRRQSAGDRVVVEVFKRPKGDRMSLFNATALGYDALFTNVDALYLDFGHDWTLRYK